MKNPKALSRSTSIAALGVILVDETTKTFARIWLPLCATHGCAAVRLGPIELVRQENAGSALGFAQGLGVWTFVAIAGAAFVPVLARCTSHPVMAIGGGLALGGAMANLIDRIMTGRVTDFIHPGGPVVFNVADLALGAGCLLMSSFIAGVLRPSPAVEAFIGSTTGQEVDPSSADLRPAELNPTRRETAARWEEPSTLTPEETRSKSSVQCAAETTRDSRLGAAIRFPGEPAAPRGSWGLR